MKTLRYGCYTEKQKEPVKKHQHHIIALLDLYSLLLLLFVHKPLLDINLESNQTQRKDDYECSSETFALSRYIFYSMNK